MNRFTQRILVALFFVGVFLAAQLFGVGEYLSLMGAQMLLETLHTQVTLHPLVSILVFLGVYVVATGFSIPGATFLTLLAGALFGTWIAVAVVNIGATVGAALAFLSARFVLGEALQGRYAAQLQAFNAEIAKHGAHYILTLRLLPVFPFFLVNLLAGISAVPLRTFMWATSLGIIPGSFVYAFAGKELATITDLSMLASPGVVTAFVLLGLFALVPVMWKKMRAGV
ncbi:MAG: TVP38/TMEM64 family protein [Candidatus Pacebacteria bacterium]|nr:TVP38/TMEM64 family protein [Candidatus Paceibacterota bacterium]